MILHVDENEKHSLMSVLDVALKAQGLGALQAVTHWLSKLQRAEAAAQVAAKANGADTEHKEIEPEAAAKLADKIDQARTEH